jgi:DtxR family Mn-dependent transcriptional regulator
VDENSELLKSESVQNFLKSVYALQQSMARVSTNAMADLRGISAPSVTDMAQRLEEAGLIDYQKYRGMGLTDAGERAALVIIRRHRLIELYLVEELSYDLHEVHDEADRLEHAVSDRFIEAIADKLDHPLLDPHGAPIPSAEGVIARRELLPLTEWPEQVTGRVGRITAPTQEMLQYIIDRGFRLGALLHVVGRDPFDGPLRVRLADESDAEHVIGFSVAEFILVEASDEPA